MAGRTAALLRRSEYDVAEADRLALARLALTLSTRGLHDRRVLAAIAALPRTLFVAAADHAKALEDRPVPIECGQTLDAPSVHALVWQAAEIAPEHRVLEIGTGSGWGTSILAGLCTKVYTVERWRTLADLAFERFSTLDLDNVVPSVHDGLEGFPRHAPFHRIIVEGALAEVPQALLEQLAPQGILVAAHGVAGAPQTLTRWVRRDKGFTVEPLAPIRRVALVPGRAAAM